MILNAKETNGLFETDSWLTLEKNELHLIT